MRTLVAGATTAMLLTLISCSQEDGRSALRNSPAPAAVAPDAQAAPATSSAQQARLDWLKATPSGFNETFAEESDTEAGH